MGNAPDLPHAHRLEPELDGDGYQQGHRRTALLRDGAQDASECQAAC